MKHIVLAVSYRAEMLEKEMKAQEERVSDLLHIAHNVTSGQI